MLFLYRFYLLSKMGDEMNDEKEILVEMMKADNGEQVVICTISNEELLNFDDDEEQDATNVEMNSDTNMDANIGRYISHMTYNAITTCYSAMSASMIEYIVLCVANFIYVTCINHSIYKSTCCNVLNNIYDIRGKNSKTPEIKMENVKCINKMQGLYAVIKSHKSDS